MPTPPAPTPATQLAAVPPSQFVAERERLAAALTRAGDRAGAAALKKMRKPTRTVWVLNQLAREDETACEELFAASDELAAVQQGGEGKAASFREVLARQRRLFDELLALARRLLDEAGEASDEATMARVSRGLRAAAAGGEVRRELRAGQLTVEPEEPGFLSLAGALGGGTDDGDGAHARQGPRASTAAKTHAPHGTREPGRETPASREEARRERLREARDEAARRLEEAARARDAAAKQGQEAGRQEEEARGERDEAVAEVERLREELTRAEARAQELGAAWGKKKRAAAEATAAHHAAVGRATLLERALASAEEALAGDD